MRAANASRETMTRKRIRETIPTDLSSTSSALSVISILSTRKPSKSIISCTQQIRTDDGGRGTSKIQPSRYGAFTMAENKETTKVEKPAKAEKAAKKSSKPSIWSRMGKFFKDYKSELKKVSWSSWKTVKTNTAIVAVSVISMSAAIGILDYLFSNLIVFIGKLI